MLINNRADTSSGNLGPEAASRSRQALRSANLSTLIFDELLEEDEIHICPAHL